MKFYFVIIIIKFYLKLKLKLKNLEEIINTTKNGCKDKKGDVKKNFFNRLMNNTFVEETVIKN